MERQELFKRISFLIVLIFGLNLLANKFYLYSGLWYFDILMHFAGGFWLGLVFFWYFWQKERSISLLQKIILGVLVVGIGWEVFELVFVNYVALNDFNTLDTLSDICFDLAGGFLAILYCESKILNFNKSTV